jgi:hypothetical protein
MPKPEIASSRVTWLVRRVSILRSRSLLFQPYNESGVGPFGAKGSAVMSTSVLLTRILDLDLSCCFDIPLNFGLHHVGTSQAEDFTRIGLV